MEEPVNDQQSTPLPGNSGRPKLQRYALRSVTKSKEEKPPVPELSSNSSSASKRGRSIPSVSRSVGVLDLSGNDKSAKPPRRLSIPTKSNVSSAKKPPGNITPISEARVRSVSSQGKSETPVSDVSRSSRKKFNILASASYWLSQIKLSEAASKHSISLGFFKLAVEARCEPLQRMHEELKSYVRRHNLDEQGDPVKGLFESFSIVANSEQLQVSVTCSLALEEGTRSSDDEVRSSSSIVRPRKLKPKSLNTDSAEISPVKESGKNASQRNNSTTRTRGYWNKNATITKPAPETDGHKSLKKPQIPYKQEPNDGKGNKKQGKISSSGKGLDSHKYDEDDTLLSNKENMDAPQIEEMTTEVI